MDADNDFDCAKGFREAEITPEEILKAIGAQVVLGEWRFPFYGKDTVAQMLPLQEWIARRQQIGNSHEALLAAAKRVAAWRVYMTLGADVKMIADFDALIEEIRKAEGK